VLLKIPKRKAECPHCGTFIFVRTRPDTREHVLADEKEAQRITEMWRNRPRKEPDYISLESRKKSETENYRIALRQRDVFPFGMIQTFGDGFICSYCRKLASSIYKIEQVPLPPHKGCTCERGCMCSFIPLSLDDYRDEMIRRRKERDSRKATEAARVKVNGNGHPVKSGGGP